MGMRQTWRLPVTQSLRLAKRFCLKIAFINISEEPQQWAALVAMAELVKLSRTSIFDCGRHRPTDFPHTKDERA
jgi:hypothetical protein